MQQLQAAQSAVLHALNAGYDAASVQSALSNRCVLEHALAKAQATVKDMAANGDISLIAMHFHQLGNDPAIPSPSFARFHCASSRSAS
jgi:hypothetical protein